MILRTLPLLLLLGFASCGSGSDGWLLVNVEERENEKPPPRAEREALAAGRVVLLVFQSDDGRPEDWNSEERIWITITEVAPGPRYAGTVGGKPKVTPNLKTGDRVEFGPEHIVEIVSKK